MILKICGLNDPDNIAELLEVQPDFMGFIFYDKSPRNARLLDPKKLPIDFGKTKKVGVFVNESKEEIARTVDQFRLDFIQLHGDESPFDCVQIKQFVNKPIIKAVGIETIKEVDHALLSSLVVDYILLDNKSQGYGGSGINFDWDLLKDVKMGLPSFLSGGISLDNIQQAKQVAATSNFIGMDVNSKFELKPGLKDVSKIRQLIKMIHE